ncbi:MULTISPECIES: zinc-dependent alcohol dehydrogenase family protein [Rhizobium]|uniref:Iditol 2-dehydrogenase n=1 Tax=Rhizobium tropici TaxID=398 RepID=A0A329Y8P6_RHITR|nr:MULTISPECIES: zinc-dependent alcohol dehydrogenase family protein [Rhizobium]MBB3285450.1 L-iditol 2-dehydrogenase [Rhizobium sp. BK252]MBB3400190.1 L-iditol 2-dehydrogenase [Rhizobium sp. BK289]MBB3412769.1 L-iditol 2-dehydrogenase [Rhizobium sp. BK284]MBB3480656.1 L-iditol 2-dehydrogenase [Rhizobium sp. BK347]MDK4719315.1 zinc-dependent alcohol dehydrogenase family protein [Rhizobium sp. CNPSo 3968]
MRAVRLEAIGSMAMRNVEKPSAGPGDIIVRVLAAGVCGSDRHMYKGEYPTSMPVALGHEFCGLVEEVGEGVSSFMGGELVTVDPNIACGTCHACRHGRPNLCANLKAIGVTRDGGFADYVAVPCGQAFTLPPDLNPVHGAFCEPLACCIHAIDKAKIRRGDSVAILGGGVIGLLMVQLARLAGADRIILITRQLSRREAALRLGATLALDPTATDAVAAVRDATGGGVDVVIECAGVPETLQTGVRMARRGGVFVLFGVTPAGLEVPVLPFDLLVNEVEIRPAYLNPFTHSRAAAMVASGILELDSLVTKTIGLEEVASVVGSAPLAGEIKVIVRP